MRTVEEWVGKTDDSMPTAACKRRILERQGYCCAITGRKFSAGETPQFDHIVPLWLGGFNHETNLQAITAESHKRKTATEAAVRSKVNKQINKSFGLKETKNPLPGSRASGIRKRMNGTVERW